MGTRAAKLSKQAGDLVLKVPFYSQFEKGNGLSLRWQERSCGILALKMVLDYYRRADDEEPLDLKELLAVALEHGGVNSKHNWYHSALVATAGHYGYPAWRRSWTPSQRDREHFRQERVGEKGLSAWEAQLKQEGVGAISDELARGCPVIVSAAPNFDSTNKAHLLTLVGLKRAQGAPGGFYYQDPYNQAQKGDQARYVDLGRFQEIWTYRAIFVRPKDT